MAYSIFSILMLGWLIVVAQEAPRIELWFVMALRWVPNVLMPIAFMLLGMGFAVANPLSIGRGGENISPSLPLTLALTRHPVLWGFFLWALGHVAANGEYPLVVMFGVFAAFALGGCVVIDRKRKRQWGHMWTVWAAPTRVMLCASPALWRGQFKTSRADIVGAILGLCFYGGMFALHPLLFGVSPAP